MIEGRCKQCGRCCRTFTDWIMKPTEEMRKILEMRGIKVRDIDDMTSAVIVETKPCIYLKNNKCKIYNSRPELCRTYPSDKNLILDGCGYREVSK